MGDPARESKPARGRLFVLLTASIFLLSGGATPASHGEATGFDALDAASRAEARHAYPARQHSRTHEVELRLASANPSLADRERSRIASALVRYSEQYDLDPDLVLAVIIVESDARPWAHSSAGAVGLMQVMLHMMRPMELAGNFATIESNIEAGCRILSNNIRRLGLERGISAYFWGSNIRGVAYLEKVLEARERVRAPRAS